MLKIGILGLGTVGSGVVKIMQQNSANIHNKVGTNLEIEKILVSNINKDRIVDIEAGILTEDETEILDNPAIDIVVELIGGEEPAYQYIMRAIENGKHIVTANKLVIAKHGKEIFKKAEEKNVQVSYEASVAGGLPIIRPLQNSLAANRIEKIYGILNGTTNYILTKMSEENQSFEEALLNAQEMGYAESDPTSDVDGYDAAYKITILSSLAFQRFVDVENVYVEGIRNIAIDDIKFAKEMGYVIKLLAIAKNSEEGLDIRVHPAFVPENHTLAMINNTYNCVYLHGDAVGEVMSSAEGAGQMPTGSAVVADIIHISKNINYNKQEFPKIDASEDNNIIETKEIESSFYIRLSVFDKPGVMAKIAKIFGDNNVSLASVLQKQRLNPVVPLVLITHSVKEKYLYRSIDQIKELEDVRDINSVIRVEKHI
ncbi:homoserine dehydrogenase [Halanaerobium sp. Z-7514]|uniref:Homoserine dehydrogenase n=1 Tax=Halanaerobium polyolivorans TaxID=2886943 RepID=A0AAW4WZY4_9FIRM|nr:homoserine dehydrogenase [Halanaerobium polyolivorans]MCC3143971.1 homoserine dehydrogenase [Halanaerobium polyolivorans]RQD72692.1 MAG: homoserine dehydrogenase [Halanaerobium sp. MSAO_Bac5]